MQGNSRIISPIAIDLGTKHNGVFLSHYREGEDPSQNSKVGTTFIVDNSKKTWSQADRTAKRHQRRGFKRRKLVKRLFRIILVELYHYDPITQPRVDRDFLLGLFNRRGFSYLTDDIDEEILTYADLSILEEFIPKLFNPSSKLNLLEQLVQKQENESELEKILDAEIFQISKKEQLTKVKEFFEDNTEQNDYLEILNSIKSFVTSFQKAKIEGHKPRKQYFASIHKDIEKYFKNPAGKELQKKLGFSARNFSNLVGNLSNLQLRTLRKYFNDPLMANGKDKWKPENLKKIYSHWIHSWHVKKDEHDLKRKETIKDKLKNEVSFIDFLLKTEPELTIPPYEDMNNRRINKCRTLYISFKQIAKFDPNWQIMTDKLIEILTEKDQLNGIDIYSENHKLALDTQFKTAKFQSHQVGSNNSSKIKLDLTNDDKKRLDQLKKVRVLQRILDRNSKIDNWKLRFLCNCLQGIESKKIETSNLLKIGNSIEFNRENDKVVFATYINGLVNDIGEIHAKSLLLLAIHYYKAIRNARKGLWYESTQDNDSNNILEVCGNKPKQKKNESKRLIGNVLFTDFHKDDESIYNNFITNLKETKISANSRITILSICKSIEQKRKKVGESFGDFYNRFVYMYKNNPNSKELTQKPENKEFLKIFKDTEIASKKIAELLNHNEHQYSKYNNPFSLTQLYNILEGDRHGFTSTCSVCQAEDSLRTYTQVLKTENKEILGSICTRLSNDSVRPFDGQLARILESLAYKISHQKLKQIETAGIKKNEELFIPICIEENRFLSALAIKEIKGISKASEKFKRAIESLERVEEIFEEKNNRIKIASRGVCPYSGHKIQTGEIDHILPRSLTRDASGTIINSEMNLIYVSGKGNQIKGNHVYSLNNLNGKYLKQVFGTSSITEIEKKIRKIIELLYEKAKKNRSPILFHTLTPEEQDCFRHALFLDLSKDGLGEKISQVISNRNKSGVNGTQSFLAKLIQKILRNEIPKKFPGVNFNFDTIGVSAEDASKFRNNLSDYKPIYTKQKGGKQSEISHILDAVCVFSAASEKQIEMRASAFSGSEKHLQGEWIESLLPDSYEFASISRRPKSQKSSEEIESEILFKDSIYAERFLPLLITKEGKLRYGFNLQDSLENFDPDFGKQFFTSIQEYLEFNGKGVHLNFDEWITKANESKRDYLYFTVNKPKFFNKISETHLNSINEGMENQFKILLSLKYTTNKNNIETTIIDTTNGKVKSFDIEKNCSNKFEVWSPYGKKSDGKLVLPFAKDWELLLNNKEIKNFLKSKTVKIDIHQFHLALRTYFLKNNLTIEKDHQGVRKVYSLPLIDSPSGGFRIKRKTPFGDSVHQLQAVNSDTSIGLNKSENLIDFTQSVLMETYNRHPQSNDIVNATGGDVENILSRREIAIPIEFEDSVIQILMAPGTKSRRYIWLTLKTKYFLNHLADFIDMDEKPDSIFTMPSSFKLIFDKNEDTKKYFPFQPRIDKGKTSIIEVHKIFTTEILLFYVSPKSSDSDSAYQIGTPLKE